MTSAGRGRRRTAFAASARLGVAALVVAGACTGAGRREGGAPPSTTASSGSTVAAAEVGGASPPDALPAADTPAAGSSPRPGGRAGTGTTAAAPLAGSSTTTTTTTSAPKATGAKCPDPRTCDVYRVIPGTKGWRPGTDGTAHIPVYINPTPPVGSSLTADTLEADILAMMGMWEEASPAVRFRYLGRTVRQPRTGDGFNDLSLGSAVQTRVDFEGYLVEADVLRSPSGTQDGLVSNPCDWHRDGGCDTGPAGKIDTRHAMAHELGHILGSADLSSPETAELTMDHAGEPRLGHRDAVTLGLGDVLFVRHLYPCACPLPRIYVP